MTDKTYTTSFFPLSLDKSILRTARNVKPLVTEADQNMMRSHTNDLLNRTRINNTNKRKQDFSKWMRTKLKHLQRPENRLNVEMLNDEERKDLFDEKLGIVRDCIAGYEGAHLASQTNAELHEAIEDLHIKQFLLIDMTEAELVDISDQEEFKSINIRLLHIITLYKEHLFSLENPDVNEQSLNALSPLKPREPSSSPIQPSRPQTPHINELPQMNIPVAVRSRAESLRKPRASPTNGSPRLPAASPVRPSSANDSTRGMRSPSAAFNATRSPSAATIEDSPRPPRTPSLQVADLTAAGTVFLTGSPVSPVSQVSPRPRSDSMNWSRRGSSRRSKSRDSAAGDSKSREGSVLVDGVKRAESPSETSVLREDIREEERDVRQVESPVGSSVETSPLLHTRKMAASVPGIHHIDEEGPNLVTAVADSLEESKSRSPEKIQVIRRSSSGSIQNMFASRRASLDRRSTTEKRRSSSYNRIGSETDLTDALGTSPLAASPAKVIMQRTGSNTTRRAGGILAEVISEQSPMHSVQVLDTIGRSHSLLDASLSAASLSVPCSGLPSSKRLSIAESINSILSRVEGIEVSAMPSLEKSEPVLEKGIDATVEATAGADMC
ncbi:hypothetical protein BC830DRAFT_1151521 [Chytriomyces sp. MP71]|nr:hypothetical protein BC830DRAFT_1151521 [Chytriomyces sp. MP71]